MIYYGAHHITRKIVAAFMDFFTSVSIQKYHLDAQGNPIVYKQVTVPIMFATTDRWLQVMRSSTNLKVYDPLEREKRPIEIERMLPRMGLNITGFTYMSERHMTKTTTLKDYNGNKYSDTTRTNIYAPVPYSIEMELGILSKNINEGFEIMEQILPFFSPSLSLDIKIFDDKESESVPFSLVSVMTDMVDEFNEGDDRLYTITLSFNAKVNYYLPSKIDSAVQHYNITTNHVPTVLTDGMTNDLLNLGYSQNQILKEYANINFESLMTQLLVYLRTIVNETVPNIITDLKNWDETHDFAYTDLIAWIIQELNAGRTILEIIAQLEQYLLDTETKFNIGDSLFSQMLTKLKLKGLGRPTKAAKDEFNSPGKETTEICL